MGFLDETGLERLKGKMDSAYAPKSHTHNYAGSASAGGSANSAVKLYTPRTLTIGNTGKTFNGESNVSWTLTEIGAKHSWNAVTQGKTWSRICYVACAYTTEGSSFILQVSCTRQNVVCNATFLITTSHLQKGNIVQLQSTTYSTFVIRTVADSNGSVYVEIYDDTNNIATGTAQTWHCNLIPISTGAITKYTSFTSGATMPSGFALGKQLNVSSRNNIVADKFIGDLSGNATTATGVLDYNNTNSTIKIGYSGDGLTTSAAKYFAAYTDGPKIKDLSFANAATIIKNNASGSWGISVTGSSASCTGNAATASAVYSTTTNPSTGTAYAMPFHSRSSNGNKGLLNNDGIRYWTLQGTTSALGYGEIGLGNNIVSGTAGNKTGCFYLYGNSSGYTEYFPFCNTTTNYTRYLVGTASKDTAVGSATQPTYISSNGTITACTSYANATVGAANKLATARTISLTGSVTGSGSFDGSGNLSIATSTNHTHSQYYDSGISRTANTVLAAPNGSAGGATFRALVAADIPNLAASKITSGTLGTDRIPNLAAGKITSGTLGVDRIPNLSTDKLTSGTLPVGRGGTGATAKGSTLLSNLGITFGTSAPGASGTAGTIYIQYA